jgi:hypothetical protein
MTPAEIIAEARRLINDTRAPQRYSDNTLLGFTNQTLKRAAMFRPDLFLFLGDVPTTPNTTVQTMPADSIRLVDIFGIKDGDTITEVNRETFDQTYPGWRSEPAGQPVNFMRHVRNPNTYFLYPRPVAGVILLAEYAKVPTDYTLNSPIDAPIDAYFPSIVDGVVFLAESIDDEHVNSGRAKLFFDTFTQGLGISLQSREVTDSESAGLDPKGIG